MTQNNNKSSLALVSPLLATKYAYFVNQPLCRQTSDGGLALLTDSIEIEMRNHKEKTWCVKIDRCYVLNDKCEPEYEPQPSERMSDFIKRTRFDLCKAIELAEQFLKLHIPYIPQNRKN